MQKSVFFATRRSAYKRGSFTLWRQIMGAKNLACKMVTIKHIYYGLPADFQCETFSWRKFFNAVLSNLRFSSAEPGLGTC